MSDKQVKELKDKLEIEKKRAAEHLAGWQRAKADYLNREREIGKEKVEWIKFANLELVLNLLPILDSFEQLTKNLAEGLKNDGWVNGVLKIKEQLENFLKNQGVEKIKTAGEKFNTEFHEAIEKRGESGEIVEEIQAGYKMHEQVIRPAKVIIK